MFEKILYLDSSPIALNSFKRVYKRKFDIITASTVEDGLKILSEKSNFAVIISSYRLNGTDGIEFLAKSGKISPLSVKIIITEQNDMNVAIRAVNECEIFRFLIMPTSQETIETTLIDSVKQYRINKIVHEEILKNKDDHEFVNLCSFCKKVRVDSEETDDSEKWEEPELYFSRTFNIKFLQGICPDCVNKLYSMLSD